jgi:hypothetical protein
MNAESIFEELGVSAITGVNLLDWLSISPEELSIPQRFSKLQGIIGFLKSFPEDTQRFLVNKATRGKQVDKLDHMFEYTNLLTKKSEHEQELKMIEQEKSVVAFDQVRMDELQLRESEVKKNLDQTLEEVYLYER